MGSWRSAGIVLPSRTAAMGQKRSSSSPAPYWFPEELNVSKRDWNEGDGTHPGRRCYAQNSRASPHRRRMSRCRADGDLGTPVDITEPAAVGILPLGFDFGEERLESGVVFVLVVQGVLLASQGRAVLLARLQPQLCQFSGKSNGIAEPRADGVFDLDDGTSETAFTTDKDVLRVGPVELVMGGRVDGGDAFVGEGEDPIAGVAVAGVDLPEQEREGALRIVGLPGDGDA